MAPSILILVNNAPNYRPYYISLGRKLEEKGFRISFALDSRITDYLYSKYKTNHRCEYFTDYFRENYEKESPDSEVYFESFSKILFADMERFYYSGLHRDKCTHYWQALTHNLINFFEYCFEKYNIDAVLYENVSNAFAYAAYLVTKKRNKKYIGLAWSRLPYDVFEIHSGIDVAWQVEEASIELTGLKKDQFEKYTHAFTKEGVQPSYMRNNPSSVNVRYSKRYFSTAKLCKLLALLSYYIKCRDEIYYNFQNGNPLKLSLAMVRRNFFRKVRLSLVRKCHSLPKPGEKFFFYPLHYHPEASTSICAPYFINEAEVIRNISFSLPAGCMLYVKEHPNAVGYNCLDFYSKVKCLPNVRVISHTYSVRSLILDSLAVVTLTSTVGFEALVLGKQVVLLGEVFYKLFPNVMVMEGWEQLSILLEKCLAPNHKHKISSQANMLALKKYFSFVYEGRLFDNAESQVEKVAQAVKGYLDVG